MILGSRLSWVDYDTQGPWETDRFRENRKIIPYGGIVYDVNDTTSVYASYTEIYKMQSNYSVDNKLLEPTTGSNYEVGVKNELFDGRLNTSLALFQVGSDRPCAGRARGWARVWAHARFAVLHRGRQSTKPRVRCRGLGRVDARVECLHGLHLQPSKIRGG